MRRDVYDPRQIGYRVDFAAGVILRGGECTRKFDTCFEMGDGEEVARRLYRRARHNPSLAAALPRYVRPPRDDEYEAAVVLGGRQVYQADGFQTAGEALANLTREIAGLSIADISELRDARIVVTRTPSDGDERWESLLDSQYPPDCPGIFRERRWSR